MENNKSTFQTESIYLHLCGSRAKKEDGRRPSLHASVQNRLPSIPDSYRRTVSVNQNNVFQLP